MLKERMYVSVISVADTMLARFYNFFEKLKVENLVYIWKQFTCLMDTFKFISRNEKKILNKLSSLFPGNDIG